jgi:hypothetical protein
LYNFRISKKLNATAVQSGYTDTIIRRPSCISSPFVVIGNALSAKNNRITVLQIIQLTTRPNGKAINSMDTKPSDVEIRFAEHKIKTHITQ